MKISKKGVDFEIQHVRGNYYSVTASAGRFETYPDDEKGETEMIPMGLVGFGAPNKEGNIEFPIPNNRYVFPDGTPCGGLILDEKITRIPSVNDNKVFSECYEYPKRPQLDGHWEDDED